MQPVDQTPVVSGDTAGPRVELARQAWERACAVVGLYGDATVPWSIVLQADLDEPLPADQVRARMTALADRYPHLGPPPDIQLAIDVPRVRDEFACLAYDGEHSLVRVALAASPPALLLAAHHGAVDGLGLLALLQAATGQPVHSTATGLAARPASHSFAVSAAQRLAEALFAPPARLRPARAGRPHATVQNGHRGSAEVLGGRDEVLVSATLAPVRLDEVLVSATLAPVRLDTARLAAAAVAVTAWWNAAAGHRADRIVAGIGASRRDGTDLQPEHRAAYLRLRLRPGDRDGHVRDLLGQHAPEPDFPVSRGRIMGLARRVLADRLGATFLVSNLGRVQVGAPVRALAFYPQPSGPLGVAFGAVSTAAATSLTIRTRQLAHPLPAATELLDRLAAELSRVDGAVP